MIRTYVVLTINDSKAINKSIGSELSAKLRKIGCRCVLDNGRKELVHCSLPIACFNLFRTLKNDHVTIKSMIVWEFHRVVCSLTVLTSTSMGYEQDHGTFVVYAANANKRR